MLHEAVAKTLLATVNSGEATAAEIQAAIKFLKDNNITSAIEAGNTLDTLKKALPRFDDDDNVVAIR